MKIYKNRHDTKYQNVLKERLSIDGPNGLMEKAIKVEVPLVHDNKRYFHCCRFDFVGIAASTFFDSGGEFTKHNVAEQMELIFKNASILNEKGRFVKMRILFVYPYTSYIFSRIQAESTRNRSSMEEPIYIKKLSIVEQVDEKSFLQSTTYRNLMIALEQLQIWAEENNWNSISSPNQVVLRFTPINPGMCSLVLNDTVFYEPYIFAKKKRSSKRLSLNIPIVQVEKDKNLEAYKAAEDHFRYLWSLETTLDCDDATYYQRGVPNSLTHLKQPTKINFRVKAKRLAAKQPESTKRDVDNWQFLVNHIFSRYCLDTAPTPSSESLFIACSWEKEKDERFVPNKLARDLSNWLDTDLGTKIDQPALSVNIMEAATGDFLTRQLYSKLKEATIALVLLTKDITFKEQAPLTKPNVYHELGYLMRQLEPGRMLVVCEDNVYVPSNINDVVRINFPEGKLILCYREILGWLQRILSFSNNELISNALKNIIPRLDKMVEKHLIFVDESNRAKERVSEDRDRL